MPRLTGSSTVSKLSDSILGCFSHLQTSETIEHLVRYLGTWSGSDKLFMLFQYTLKLVVPFLHLRARLQYRTGKRKHPKSNAAENYSKLSDLISNSRTLWRIWGILPIFQWLISIEKSPPATRELLTIERLQGWSMLLYYPLEQLSYLGYHGIIPSSFTSPLSMFSSKKRKIPLNPDTLSMWSCRFWAVYVILHFFHLIEDRKLLRQRIASIRKAKGTGLSKEEKEEMVERWDALWSEVLINLGYLPMTIHWSLEKGLFKNDAWISVFGLIAAVGSFRSGWKATALPSSAPLKNPEDTVEASPPEVPGYDLAS